MSYGIHINGRPFEEEPRAASACAPTSASAAGSA